MLKLFDIFKTGLITLLTSPFWLLYFIYKMIFCLIIFIITLIKAIIDFFKGKPIFNTREDRAIETLRNEDQQALEQRRKEAMKNADVI